MNLPGSEDPLAALPVAVRQAFEEGWMLQQQGRQGDAIASFDRGISLWQSMDGGSNFEVATVRSTLAGMTADIGRHQEALTRSSQALRDWEGFAGPARLLWSGVCYHARAMALDELGDTFGGLCEGLRGLRFLRAFVHGQTGFNDVPGCPGIEPRELNELLERSANAQIPAPDLGAFGGFMATTFARQSRTISMLYFKLGRFEESLWWLDHLYRSISTVQGLVRVAIVAEAGKGYEQIATAETVKDLDIKVREVVHRRLRLLGEAIEPLASSRPSSAVDALEHDIQLQAGSDDEVSGDVEAILSRADHSLLENNIQSAIEGFTEAVQAFERGGSRGFCSRIAEARLSLATMLADLQVVGTYPDLVTASKMDWDCYPGGDRLFRIASYRQVHAQALLQSGRTSEAIVESQIALKLYASWIEGKLSPPDSVKAADIQPEDAVDLIAKFESTGRAALHEVIMVAAAIVRSCVNIAHGLAKRGDGLEALSWLAALQYEVDRLSATPEGRPLAIIEFHGYGVLFQLAFSMEPSNEFELPQFVLAERRWQELEERLRGDFSGPGLANSSFDFQLAAAVGAAQSMTGRTEAYAQLEVLLSHPSCKFQSRATVLYYMACLELSLKDSPDLAASRYEEALSLLSRGDPHPIRVRCFLGLGYVYLAKARWQDALDRAGSGLKEMVMLSLADQTLTRATRFTVCAEPLLLASRALRGMGSRSAAVFAGKLALACGAWLLDQRVAQVPALQAKVGEVQYDLFGEDLCSWLIADGRLGEALLVSDLNQTNPFVRPEQERSKGPALNFAPLTPLEQTQISRFGHLVESASSHASAEEITMAIREMADSLEDANGTHVDTTTAFNDQQLGAFRNSIPWDAQTIFLRANPQSDCVQVVVVTAEKALTTSTPLDDCDLAGTVFALLRDYSDPSRALNVRNAKTIYGLVIAPVRGILDSITNARILLDSRGVLKFIPFSALHDGDAWMVEQFRFVAYPSNAVSVLLTNPATPPRVRLFGRIAEDGALGAPALPSVRSELAAISRLTGSNRFEPDGEFTLQSLLEAATNATVIHIASHFLNDPSNPSASQLLLGDGKMVAVSDVWQPSEGSASQDLVTLSACGTGSPSGPGEDLSERTPTSVLHSAGVNAVIASLWPIYSLSSAVLMEKFYAGLWGEATLDKSEALRQAQLSLLKGPQDVLAGRGLSADYSGEFTHPHYWAPFVLSGNWRPFNANVTNNVSRTVIAESESRT